MTQAKIVLAIDPGSQKCGMALVRQVPDAQGKVERLWGEVVATENIVPKLHEAHIHGAFQLIIIGSGTNSRDVVRAIRDHLPSMGILEVDEVNTTLQARERYWEYNPRRGLQRLLPASLWTPPVPYDDYAALILAERVLSGQ